MRYFYEACDGQNLIFRFGGICVYLTKQFIYDFYSMSWLHYGFRHKVIKDITGKDTTVLKTDAEILKSISDWMIANYNEIKNNPEWCDKVIVKDIQC